jgi:hypothetical protein
VTTNETFGTVHGNGTDDILTQMLLQQHVSLLPLSR